MKKIFSWVLSLALILSLLPSQALAAPVLDFSSVKEGEKIVVTLTLPDYENVMTAEAVVEFPGTVLELESVTSGVYPPLDFEDPNVTTATNNGKVTIAHTNETLGTCTVGGEYAKLTFSIKSGAAPGSYDIKLTELTMSASDYVTNIAASDAATLPKTISVVVPKAPISSVTASVDAPVKGQPLDFTGTVASGAPYSITKVEWFEGTTDTGTPVTNPATAKAEQFYYARITLKANSGETFDEKFKTGAANGDYSVTRVSNTELLLTKAYPKTGSVTVTKVQIGGAAPSLNVPEALGIDTPNTVKVTNTYSVTVHTDSGLLHNPSGVVWSISDLDGVTVDPATGNMTISSDCPGGPITLTATYGGVSSTPATLTVWRATPAVKWLKIVDKKTGGAPQTTIIRPVGDDPADMIDVEYEAKVYDQFSQPATITMVDWKLDPIPKHMGTLETVGGLYSMLLHVFHNTEAIPFDLTATLNANPAIKDTVKIKVEERPIETLTVTQADTTYGTALADPVFTAPEGTTKTLVHYSTPTSSGYSSDTPPTDAGAYVVNVVCETATHIYMGHANFKINPKSISNMLQPITGTYTYTGAPQKPTAVVMDGTKTLVEGTDYTVSYGTNVHVFEAATVYVEGKGNYTGTFSRNFKIQPKPIDIEDVKTTDRDYEEGRLDVDCTVKLPVASDVKQGTHYHVFATMADDTAGTGKTVNVLVKMEKGGLGENYTLNKDTTTAIVNINQINPADPTGLKGVKGNALSTVELPAGWNWDAPATVMNTAGPQTFKAHYAGDANHIAVSARPITVYVLDKTDVSTFITFPDGEKEYTGSWMKYEEASISGTNLGTGAKWNYIYTAGTGTLMAAGFPEGIGTYTVTATYEDSINFGIATATLTIVPKKVAIPAADTTVFTYDGSAKTYGISDTADYTVTGNSQTNAGDHTVTVALRDKATTAWADGTTADKTYTFTIKQATPTGEPAYTKITTSGKTLADAGLTVTGSTLNPNAGTLEWVDDAGNVLPDTTTVAANTTYKWRFTPTNTNYTTLTGSIKLYHKSSSSGGSSHSSRYTITVDSVKHGTITVSPKSAYKGDTVTITVKPDAGYEIDKVTVTDSKGNTITVTDKGDGKFSFTMPDSKVDVKATFVKSEVKPDQPSKTAFVDVPENSWYADAADFVAQRGLMSGVGENLFGGGQNTTRAMLMTILARMDGQDVTGGATWYEKAMNWAKANGVSDGTMPEVNITREQLATMLYSYAKLKGMDPIPNGMALSKFSDADSISTWASEAVSWAAYSGIISGRSNGTVDPQAGATRAEMAVMLQQFVGLMEQ